MTLPYFINGTGEPILFLHGLGNNKHLWDSQHELSSKYQLIIPDLRGHGENDIKTDITLPNLAADVLELMDSLSIGSTNICGLSMGGLVALQMFKQAPKRVKALILTNTTAYCIPWLISSNAYDNIRKLSEEEVKTYIVQHSLHKKDQEIIQKAERSFEIHKEAFLEAAQNCSKANYVTLLPFINIPCLIINGLKDQVTPPLLSYQMKWGIPHARFRSLNNGHLSNIESTQQFNKLIVDFMEEKHWLASNRMPFFTIKTYFS